MDKTFLTGSISVNLHGQDGWRNITWSPAAEALSTKTIARSEFGDRSKQQKEYLSEVNELKVSRMV